MDWGTGIALAGVAASVGGPTLAWGMRLDRKVAEHIAEDKAIHASVDASLKQLVDGQNRLIEHLLDKK